MTRPSFRVHLAGDSEGLYVGRLVARAAEPSSVVVVGQSEEEVLETLQERVASLLERDSSALDAFHWTETLRRSELTVEVRPQTTVEKRAVIGKATVPLELTYWWAALVSQTTGAGAKTAGYRVMLPRFDWWFVLEDLGMAAEVVKQAISTALGGEKPQSVFEFRAIGEERVIEWRPKLKHRSASGDDDLRERFSALHQVAEDWTRMARTKKLGAHYGAVDAARLETLIQSEPKPSLLLVGPSGVGKTAWVRELARRLGRSFPEGDAYAPRLWATSADRIMAGMQYLGMWEQRCLDIAYELSGEGHWLYVDRLAALARTRTGASSIADLLQPAVLSGEISLIAEATEAELARLSVEVPSLISAFTVVRLSEPEPERMVELLEEIQDRTDATRRFHPDVGRRLVRHLELFRKDYAFPGKLFHFTIWLEQQPKARRQTLTGRQADTLFCQWSGLAEALVSDDRRGDVETLTAGLTDRVIGQDEACRAAARVLSRFKAGVNHPDKPLGSLLFVGPTGVGKTELAKQLARFVFGGTQRMIRLDMSEYLFAHSAMRMLSDERGAESLVQKIARQPLSLVLLDEIEKAHPAVFDLLLAVLGEGRLTSSSGRRVDLRMTLIVMTSNLGTGTSRVGFGQEGADARDAYRAVRDHFRPEFFNRLDQVVPFGALGPEALRRIVDLELAALTDREGLRRRNIRLRVSDDARVRLAELGFHPKYGARPLKRVIEELVMTPIAVAIARQPKMRDARAEVTIVQSEVKVAVG